MSVGAQRPGDIDVGHLAMTKLISAAVNPS